MIHLPESPAAAGPIGGLMLDLIGWRWYVVRDHLRTMIRKITICMSVVCVGRSLKRRCTCTAHQYTRWVYLVAR